MKEVGTKHSSLSTAARAYVQRPRVQRDLEYYKAPAHLLEAAYQAGYRAGLKDSGRVGVLGAERQAARALLASDAACRRAAAIWHKAGTFAEVARAMAVTNVWARKLVDRGLQLTR